MKAVILMIFAVGLFYVAARQYLGYHFFHKYQAARGQARSIEESFTKLETNLAKAVKFNKNPEFYKEKARLYLEMALAENQFGEEEKRDEYCDLSRNVLVEAIERNPVDAFAYYEMGKVYLLYNFPLLTYFDKGKIYFRRALELNPADEFLNHNILYIFLTQWASLDEKEHIFVLGRINSMQKNHDRFIPGLCSRWKKNFGDTEKLDDIFKQTKD